MAVTMYGIKNCDTIKKARSWLEGQGIAYDFHDYKRAGIDRATLDAWVAQLGWEALLNRSGITFRKLPDADRNNIDEAKAIALMETQPSMIKRPLLDVDGRLTAGFRPADYEKIFAR